MNLSRVLLGGLFAASLWGCSPPPDVEEVAQETSARASALVKGALRSTKTLENHEGLNTFTTGMQAVQGVLRGSPIDASSTPTPYAGFQYDDSTQTQTEQQIDAIGQFLKERVFVQKNVESSGGGAVVFRLQRDTVCGDLPTMERQSCNLQIDLLEPRIRVSKVGNDDLQLEFQLTSDKVQPLALVIGTQRLAVITDLSAVKTLYSRYGGAAQGLPETFEGKIELSLQKNAEDDYTLAAGILAAVQVAATTPDGQRFEFSSAARTMVASWRIEGAARRLTSEVDLGATRLVAPARSLSPSLSGAYTLELPGMSYAFIAEPGQSDVHVSNVGFGDAQATYTLNGTKLFGLDLNPGSGRRLDVRLVPNPDGQVTIHFSPQLDVITRFAFGSVASELSSPAFLLDHEYRWNLNGPAGVSIASVAATDTSPAALKIVTGTLVVESLRSNPGSLNVEAGQCLVSTHLSGNDQPLLSYFKSQPCP